MSEAEYLRERAARLLAMALKSRDEGDVDRADLLVSRANSYVERAEILEKAAGVDHSSTKTLRTRCSTTTGIQPDDEHETG